MIWAFSVVELSVLIWCSLHVKQVLNAPTKPSTFCYFLHEIVAESQTPNSWVAVSLATWRLEEKKRKVFISMPRREVLWDYMQQTYCKKWWLLTSLWNSRMEKGDLRSSHGRRWLADCDRSLDDQVMAGFITGVCTVDRLNRAPIEKPVSNRVCYLLQYPKI